MIKRVRNLLKCKKEREVDNQGGRGQWTAIYTYPPKLYVEIALLFVGLKTFMTGCVQTFTSMILIDRRNNLSSIVLSPKIPGLNKSEKETE